MTFLETIAEHVWTNLGAYITLLVVLYLFMWVPIQARRLRRRNRRALRRLLGDAYSEDKSLVKSNQALAIDEDTGRLAYIEARLRKPSREVVIKFDEILEIEYPAGNTSVPFLLILTSRVELPRISILVFFASTILVQDIYKRIKHHLDKRDTKKESEPVSSPGPNDQGLKDAIQELTKAVWALAEATKGQSSIK